MNEVKNIIAKMSIEQKVGQLFILAFPGKDYKKVLPLIDGYQIAGCYMSGDNASNFKEAKNLNDALQKEALKLYPSLPLILGVDQEGAWGMLIPHSTIGPGNLALGKVDDINITQSIYKIYANEMSGVGYQTLLSPCCDINLDPKNPIIGTRSFGDNPLLVSKHVKAAIRGAKEGGAITTAKHFPGHGDTNKDTHRDVPVVDKSKEVLLQNELLPFQEAINCGVDLIMTAHILFPQIDKKYPATLSYEILTNLLKKQMGFRGLVITDSMNMGAMRHHYTHKEASILALKAGADLIMLSEEHYDHSDGYFKKQVELIKDIICAVKDGQIPISIIEDKLERIISFKLDKKGLFNGNNKGKLSNKKDIEEEAARRAIAIIRNENSALPVGINSNIAVVNTTPKSSYHNIVNVRGIGPNQEKPASATFKEEIEKVSKNATFFEYESIFDSIEVLSGYDKIIAITEDYPLPGEDFETTNSKNFVEKLSKSYNKKLIVVALRSPYELQEFKEYIGCYISSYSSRTCSAKEMARYLFA